MFVIGNVSAVSGLCILHATLFNLRQRRAVNCEPAINRPSLLTYLPSIDNGVALRVEANSPANVVTVTDRPPARLPRWRRTHRALCTLAWSRAVVDISRPRELMDRSPTSQTEFCQFSTGLFHRIAIAMIVRGRTRAVPCVRLGSTTDHLAECAMATTVFIDQDPN